MNGVIKKTQFTPWGRVETIVDSGDKIYKETMNTSVMKKSMMDELEKAMTKLEGYANQVNNCDCTRIYTCQTLLCQEKRKNVSAKNWQTCQSSTNCTEYDSCQKISCQYFTCQKVICQRGMSCQTCQACEHCQTCEDCESQCLCQTCQVCQDKTYDVYSCQEIKCQSCQSCQLLLCENVSCQARKSDGKDLVE